MSCTCFELAAHPVEVLDDDGVAGGLVGGLQHGAYVVDRQVEVAEPADQPGLGDLLGAVVAVAAARVGPGRLQQPHVVIVPQRLHGQEGHPREVADGQQAVHAHSLHSPPAGESSGPNTGLTLPLREAGERSP